MEKVDIGDFLSSSNTGDFLVGDDGLSQSLLRSTSSLQWLAFGGLYQIMWSGFFFFENVTSISSEMDISEV